MHKPTKEEWVKWAEGAADTHNIKIKYLDCVQPTDEDIAMPDINEQIREAKNES